MKNIRVYQPTFTTVKDEDIEGYVFEDILSSPAVSQFPSYVGFDSIGSWTHEFTELVLFCLILYETQFMDDLKVVLHMKDSIHYLETNLPHFLTSLSCESERILSGKRETHTPDDYLDAFETNLQRISI